MAESIRLLAACEKTSPVKSTVVSGQARSVLRDLGTAAVHRGSSKNVLKLEMNHPDQVGKWTPGS